MAINTIKANYEVDQKAGNSIMISQPCTVVHGGYDLLRCFIPFPFYAENTNYSISNIDINVINVGRLTWSVLNKQRDGVALKASISGVNGAYLADGLSFKLTFA